MCARLLCFFVLYAALSAAFPTPSVLAQFLPPHTRRLRQTKRSQRLGDTHANDTSRNEREEFEEGANPKERVESDSF